MLTKTLLIEVRGTFDLAVIVGAFGILINLERSLSTGRHVSVHECCSVTLELGALRLDLKLIITIESCSVLFVKTGFLVNSNSCSDTCGRLDFEAYSLALTSVEGSLISLKSGALRFSLSCFSKEASCVVLVTLSIHVCRFDSILNIGELVAKCLTWINSSFNSAIKELLSCLLILRSCVADISLEEFLLSMSKVWVVLDLAGDVLEWILNATFLSASLVKLVVA